MERTNDNFEINLNNMLHACSQQARWHHEQYLRLQYCQQYFTYLLHCRQQFDENHLENLLRNLSTRSADGKFQPTMECGETGSRVELSRDINSPIRKKKKKRKSKAKAKANANNRCYDEYRNTESETVDNENESELDLDERFKEFLRESAKFRSERDSKKNIFTPTHDPSSSNPLKEEIEVEYVDIMRKGPDGSVLPPTAQNRKVLYEEKYGKSGTTILSLETALQWKYNKFVDSTRPVTWPALPLRLVYDE